MEATGAIVTKQWLHSSDIESMINHAVDTRYEDRETSLQVIKSCRNRMVKEIELDKGSKNIDCGRLVVPVEYLPTKVLLKMYRDLEDTRDGDLPFKG